MEKAAKSAKGKRVLDEKRCLPSTSKEVEVVDLAEDSDSSNSEISVIPVKQNKAERSYSCQYCDKVLKNPADKEAHERTHTGEKPFECRYCYEAFTETSDCRAHEQSHDGSRPFCCRYCDQKFGDFISRKNHERLAHPGQKPYKCSMCSEAFLDQSARKLHCQQAHSKTSYPCSECDEVFSSQDNLKNHETTHSDEVNHTCELCQKKFHTSSALNDHMARHSKRERTQKRPHECHFCSLTFKSKYSCLLHMQSQHKKRWKELEGEAEETDDPDATDDGGYAKAESRPPRAKLAKTGDHRDDRISRNSEDETSSSSSGSSTSEETDDNATGEHCSPVNESRSESNDPPVENASTSCTQPNRTTEGPLRLEAFGKRFRVEQCPTNPLKWSVTSLDSDESDTDE